MFLERTKKFRDDEDPCSVCIVAPMCKNACIPKFEHHSRRLEFYHYLRRNIATWAMCLMFAMAVPGLVIILEVSQNLLIVGIIITSFVLFIIAALVDTQCITNKIVKEVETLTRLAGTIS